jgi:hypothetical protein
MAYEITNALRSASIIRVVDGSATIPVANLAVNANEVVAAASIKRVLWSTNGAITIVRNSQPILTLHGSGDMRLSDSGHSIANNATSDIAITVTSSGSVVLEVTKQATYTTPIEGM